MALTTALPFVHPSRRFRNGLFAVVSLIAVIAVCASCSNDNSNAPTRLRVAVVPDQSRTDLETRHRPLLQYLSQSLGIPFELIIPKDYDSTVRLFRDGKVDLAYFGGVTFLQAHKAIGAVPLVMRDVDAKFTTSFIVHAGAPGGDLAAFKGQSLSFGSRLSTSGHLMPRYFMTQKGITPETYFGDIHYSGAHDKTIQRVVDGDAAIGAVNSRVVERMIDAGTVTTRDIRILWKTPPYPDYVWAVRANTGSAFETRLRDAFLMLDHTIPEHSAILKRAHADAFLPAGQHDFDRLKLILDSTNLSVSAER